MDTQQERYKQTVQTALLHDPVQVMQYRDLSRYYTEPMDGSEQEHHLIDLLDGEFPTLTIGSYHTGQASSISLTCNEMKNVLAVLLRWHIKQIMQQENT